MDHTERLITIENTSDHAVTDTWDSKEYTFAAGAQATLRFGVGLHFADKHSEIRVVSESVGIAPDVLVDTVAIISAGPSAVDVMWDGHPYHFEPGAEARLERGLADTLITHARKDGGKLVLAGTSAPEHAVAEVPPHEPAPAEQASADTTEKSKKRSKKAAE